MEAQRLYDLAPLAHMAGLAIVIALGPLAWIWLRHRGGQPGTRLRALTLLTLFLTFDLVLFGAFTRLTDSGLGCPDWPGCYGNASPLGASAEIHAAQSAMPTGPVTFSKAWIEMIHRYLATAVGVLITVLVVASWVQARRGRLAVSPWWATVTLIWVCLQGAFGALTVTMKLYPAIVTLHLLGGVGLLVLLAALGQAYVPAPLSMSAANYRASWLLAGLLLVQIALGGWVSTNYAVLACTDFPKCQGAWWPAMDFEHGFAVLRELGVAKDGSFLSFQALTAIHVTHRIGALVVLPAMLWLAWRLHAGRQPAMRPWALGLTLLAGWQLFSGLSNVVLGWPLLAAVAHTGGAAATTVLLTLMILRARQGRVPVRRDAGSGGRVPAAS